MKLYNPLYRQCVTDIAILEGQIDDEEVWSMPAPRREWYTKEEIVQAAEVNGGYKYGLGESQLRRWMGL